MKPITGAVLAGLMRTWSDTVNMVNAPVPGARSAGFDVREIRHEREGDYHTLVAVTVGTEHGPRRGRRAPCSATARRGWSKCSGSPVEAELAGEMIYIVNERRAGLHRRARHHARRSRDQHRHLQPRPPRAGGEAVALVAVDDPIDARNVARRAAGAARSVVQVVPLKF